MKYVKYGKHKYNVKNIKHKIGLSPIKYKRSPVIIAFTILTTYIIDYAIPLNKSHKS
jgi:hypothetical protein